MSRVGFGLGPRFLRPQVRPSIRSSPARNPSLPSGLPVRSCRRNSSIVSASTPPDRNSPRVPNPLQERHHLHQPVIAHLPKVSSQVWCPPSSEVTHRHYRPRSGRPLSASNSTSLISRSRGFSPLNSRRTAFAAQSPQSARSTLKGSYSTFRPTKGCVHMMRVSRADGIRRLPLSYMHRKRRLSACHAIRIARIIGSSHGSGGW